MQVGNVSDGDFLEHMDKQLGRHEHYSSRSVRLAFIIPGVGPIAVLHPPSSIAGRQTQRDDKSLRRDLDFRLKHFAGDVTYQVPETPVRRCLGRQCGPAEAQLEA